MVKAESSGYYPRTEGKDPGISWRSQIPWLKKMQDAHRFERHDGPMMHRTDMFTHLRRVAYIADHLGFYLVAEGHEQARKTYRGRIFRKAYHHDDPELITGDLPTPVKLAMSPEERAVFKQEERESVRLVASRYLSFSSERSFNDYLEEQDELLDKKTFDARLIDVADKLDGLGETLHELRCGNESFQKVYKVYRDEVFPKFENYDFWEILKRDPAIMLGNFPTNEDVSKMPILKPEDLHSRDELQVDLLEAEGLPRWYRSWTSITLNHFDINPEKFLFPGWYLELWKRWGIHGQSSHSGFIVA